MKDFKLIERHIYEAVISAAMAKITHESEDEFCTLRNYVVVKGINFVGRDTNQTFWDTVVTGQRACHVNP